MQCDLSRVILHLCHAMGTWTVHVVWHSVRRLRYLVECDCQYVDRIDVLSIVCWRLFVVVALYH